MQGSRYVQDISLLNALAEANNERDQQRYSVIRSIISDDFRDRIPASIMPWDDLTADDFEILANMVYEKDVEIRTTDILQPIKAIRIMARDVAALVKHPIWRKRLW